jgi:uncharacterized membrane protein YccC
MTMRVKSERPSPWRGYVFGAFMATAIGVLVGACVALVWSLYELVRRV